MENFYSNGRPPETESLPLNSFQELEIRNALCLKKFRGEIPAGQLRHSQSALTADIESGFWIPTTLDAEQLWSRVRTIAQRWTPVLGTRLLDSVHVACALLTRENSFVTTDARQAKLAKAMGLRLVRLA